MNEILQQKHQKNNELELFFFGVCLKRKRDRIYQIQIRLKM